MKYLVTIEMPLGCDRRIHLAFDKGGFIDCGPISDKITVNGGRTPVNYGYLLGVINGEEGDNAEYVDALVISSKVYETGDTIMCAPFAMFMREDGDTKVLVSDGTISATEFTDLPTDQQQLLLDFYGTNSPIVSVESSTATSEYVQSCPKDSTLRFLFNTEIGIDRDSNGKWGPK